MPRGREATVRGKLLAAVLSLLVAGFLVTNLVSFVVSRDALKQTILNSELPLTSSNIYSEIQTYLLRPVYVASLMSHDIFLRDWLLADQPDPDKVTHYLEELRLTYGVFTDFVVSERSRIYYHFTGPTKRLAEDDPRDAWYFRMSGLGRAYEITIDYNQAQNDIITIFVNHRIFDRQSRFIGVAGVGIKLDAVARILSRFGGDGRRNIYLIDQAGNITLRTHYAPIAESSIRKASGIDGVADEILNTVDGYFQYARDGETIFCTTRLIPELGWRIVVEQPEKDIIKSVWQGFVTNLVIGLIIISITITAIAVAVNVYQKKLERLASVDKLTGLANRQIFDGALDFTLKLRRRTKRPLALVLFDIDHFKRVNDTLGHLKGDDVLRRVVPVIRRTLREADLPCRWGGEEFIVLLDGCTARQAAEVAETVRRAVEAEPMSDPDDGLRVTISAGVAEAEDGDLPDSIIARADQALYLAKEHGRNRVWPGRDASHGVGGSEIAAS